MISLKTKDWRINDIDTVFFDKDGTLIDLHYFWGKMTELRAVEIIKIYNLKDELYTTLCSYLGYDVDSKKMLKDGITALYSRSKIIEIFKNDLKKHNIKTSTEELEVIFDNVSKKFYSNMFDYIKPIEDAVIFMKELKSIGIKLGIITSDSVESTNLTIKHFGWENLFSTIVGRESSPKTKESGALTKIALTETNTNPKNAIIIGDAPMDYLAGKNAGIEKTILVATGQLSKEELSKTSIYSIESLKQVTIIPS
ncbi:HAD family hydrolase [bacterium]|nr:HAD family hydrolase [bacterium]